MLNYSCNRIFTFIERFIFVFYQLIRKMYVYDAMIIIYIHLKKLVRIKLIENERDGLYIGVTINFLPDIIARFKYYC